MIFARPFRYMHKLHVHVYTKCHTVFVMRAILLQWLRLYSKTIHLLHNSLPLNSFEEFRRLDLQG